MSLNMKQISMQISRQINGLFFDGYEDYLSHIFCNTLLLIYIYEVLEHAYEINLFIFFFIYSPTDQFISALCSKSRVHILTQRLAILIEVCRGFSIFSRKVPKQQLYIGQDASMSYFLQFIIYKSS